MFFKTRLKGVGTEELITSVVYQDLGFLLQFENRSFFDKKITIITEGKIPNFFFPFLRDLRDGRPSFRVSLLPFTERSDKNFIIFSF
jgi:hypothetical protein